MDISISGVFQVAPFLILGAEYGHLITLRRLCAIGIIQQKNHFKLA